MNERLQGVDQQRLAHILAIASADHGQNALYMYTRDGQTKVMTAQEATEVCARHMVAATDSEIRNVLTLWREAFVDVMGQDPEAVKSARIRGLLVLKKVRSE